MLHVSAVETCRCNPGYTIGVTVWIVDIRITVVGRTGEYALGTVLYR
jgi:hypothetical protein